MSGILAAILGLATLLAAGAALAASIYLAGLWRDAVRPPRRALGFALARGLPASPEAFGLAFQERTFLAPEATVPAWIAQGRGGSGAPIVLLLHGHGRSRWDSLRRVPAWVDRASLLVLADLRGHGDAPGRSALGRREAGDIAALLGELEREHPGVRIELVGHSLGAVVAIHTAAAREALGAPIAAVHALGPYEQVRTPFNARLDARGLPAGPFSWAILRLSAMLDGAETATSASARCLARTRLWVTADATDAVSPAGEARAIAACAPLGSYEESSGVAHGELGVTAAA